jgi:citrate lyase beta subunit
VSDFRTVLTDRLDAALADADATLAARYPGAPTGRHPVHTVYLPADRCTADDVREFATTARELLATYAPSPDELARATGESVDEVAAVYDRLVAKLDQDPIEDLRADFEDGYGVRPDDAEDGHLAGVLDGFGDLAGRKQLPTWHGIRFKSFEAPTRSRGVRTLVDYLAGMTRAGLLQGNVLTLPKVTSVDQVAAMDTACTALEQELQLPSGSVHFEVQVETPQAILAGDGGAAVARMVHAAPGRVSSLVYGTFDYSAGLGIAAAYQALDHPAADHAKAVMQVAAAQTGTRICDGSTNVVAFGDEASAFATWRLHSGLVTRSLIRGIYQGWDMHPGHLISRYLANYLFFRRALPSAASRLAAYVHQTSDGDVMDEPATAKMLADALLRGVHCGAVGADEVESACGLTVFELSELTH